MSQSVPDTTAQDIFLRSPRDPHALPSLYHRSIWTYLALTFIIFSGTGVLIYAVYSCLQSARNNDVIIGVGRAHREKTSKPFPRSNWKSPRQNYGSQQVIIAKHKTSSPLLDESPFDFPNLTKPPAVRHTAHNLSSVTPRSTERPTPLKSLTVFDSNNIRFVAPQDPKMSKDAADMWMDPKLSPVQGSTNLPSSYPYPRRSFCRAETVRAEVRRMSRTIWL